MLIFCNKLLFLLDYVYFVWYNCFHEDNSSNLNVGGLRKMPKIIRKDLIYKGKANNVYSTNYDNLLELEASDRISAGNGEKKDIVTHKGVANNQISSAIFNLLENKGIKTHYFSEGSNPASKIVIKADMLPLEVICRLTATGSFCKRYECPDGLKFDKPFVEYTYKSDSAGDPPIDRKTILALSEQMHIKGESEIEFMDEITVQVAEILSEFFASLKVELIDFKLEFGRAPNGQLLVADEISPDTCRLIDMTTGEKLDKDRFRQNLGDVSKGYEEILKRVVK